MCNVVKNKYSQFTWVSQAWDFRNVLEDCLKQLQEPREFQENINRRMRSDIKREYVVFSKGLDEQERKEKWKRNGGKVEESIRPSEGVILLLRKDRAVRVKDHPLATRMPKCDQIL